MTGQNDTQIPQFLLNKMPDQYSQLLSTLQQEDGIAKMLMRPVYGDEGAGAPTTSQAEVFADLINIHRMDNKALADAVGVEMGIQRITPERTAKLLQDLVQGESLELIQVFNDLEDQREAILRELTDEERVTAHQQTKLNNLYSEMSDDPEEDIDSGDDLNEQVDADGPDDGELEAAVEEAEASLDAEPATDEELQAASEEVQETREEVQEDLEERGVEVDADGDDGGA